MLPPSYLDQMPDAFVQLWQQVEEQILQDVARRIGKMDAVTLTANWQLWRYQQTEALRNDVVKLLAKYTGKSETAIRKLLLQAATEAMEREDAIYYHYDMEPPPFEENASLNNLLDAGARQTCGTWQNLTATTANTVTGAFERTLDTAWLKVSTGAFDYKTAVKQAVDSLADDMPMVTYPSGHKDSIEVAARRAVLTGVNQTTGKLQVARMDEMGCEFVETTAHGGARPSHAEWQGRRFHRGGAVDYKGRHYPDFEAATGYGTGAGLCGWNCRHTFFAVFPELGDPPQWTQEQLRELNARDIEWNGKKYTAYEISQMQRARERNVRRWKKRYLAEDAAGLDTTDSAVRLRAARQSLKDFTQATGGRVDSARVSVPKFGRSEASRASAAVRQLPVRESRQQFRDNVYILPPIKGDAVTHRSVYNDLNRSEIGKKTLEWINSGKYNIEINYTTEVSRNLLGRNRGRNVVVYANNTRTVKRTTETLIHEMTHAHYDIGGSQWAEAQCISAEWMHRKGTLTVSDLRAIVKLTKELYEDYSWR